MAVLLCKVTPIKSKLSYEHSKWLIQERSQLPRTIGVCWRRGGEITPSLATDEILRDHRDSYINRKVRRINIGAAWKSLEDGSCNRRPDADKKAIVYSTRPTTQSVEKASAQLDFKTYIVSLNSCKNRCICEETKPTFVPSVTPIADLQAPPTSTD
ncbi:hypothetical protein J6590_009050 [Homalodisca vitripennis]|nr:hypothetical protein J6590_009050 [Homalodisca vitripennis]